MESPLLQPDPNDQTNSTSKGQKISRKLLRLKNAFRNLFFGCWCPQKNDDDDDNSTDTNPYASLMKMKKVAL